MSNAKQILAMLRSRAEGDEEAFFSIALQIAAAEARSGRRRTAEEIREAVDAARKRDRASASVAIPFSQPRGSLDGLIEIRTPRYVLDDVVLGPKLRSALNEVIREQRKREWLREHGKVPNRRILFVGPPGSGKTMCSEALAGQLQLPLSIIRLESLITRFMGETAAKLRLIFDETKKKRAVFLFDEFDAVGGHRTAINDVAEMRRVLNSFLQFMEEPNATDSLVVAATNHPELLDAALIRRFDCVLEFHTPTDEEVRLIVKANLQPMKYPRLAWKQVMEASRGLSQSEIVKATEDAVKTAILDERNVIKTIDVTKRLEERRQMRGAVQKDLTS